MLAHYKHRHAVRGMGSYFKAGPMDGIPFGAYYHVDTPAPAIPGQILTQTILPRNTMAGLGTTSLTDALTPSYSLITVAIAVLAGYLVGKQLGYPKAGAVATGLFGMPGMLGVAIYSSVKKRATPNRRRRHHRRRR